MGKFAVIAGAALLLAWPAAAEQANRSPLDEAADLARRATESVLRSIEPLLESIPQYAAPEILPNGDIVIRRKNPVSPVEPLPSPEKIQHT